MRYFARSGGSARGRLFEEFADELVELSAVDRLLRAVQTNTHRLQGRCSP